MDTAHERGPDRSMAVRRYREHADSYDTQTQWASPDRARVVELLDPRRGDVVLDVGCGTGLCFERVLDRIGPSGRLVAVEQCDEMLHRAEWRVKEAGWENVDLLLGSIEDVDLDDELDAVLLCFTHDVLRSPPALARVLGRLRPGGRVAAAGPMWAPWWAPGMNVMIWYVASQYVTTFEGFAAPWDRLAELVPDLRVEPQELAGMFFATGTRP
ncbi:MAG: class I SAM-dependent methyltransferase [Acidimicrobiia bacterium]